MKYCKILKYYPALDQICMYIRMLVHKQISFLTFEGLSTTFKGLMNIYRSTNLLTFVAIHT